MAQSEHLPIYKRGYELCLYLEQVVRGFSRSNKYGLGDELRTGARRVLSLVVRANSRREREPVVPGQDSEVADAMVLPTRRDPSSPACESSCLHS